MDIEILPDSYPVIYIYMIFQTANNWCSNPDIGICLIITESSESILNLIDLLEGTLRSMVLVSIYTLVFFPQLVKCLDTLEKCRKIPKDTSNFNLMPKVSLRTCDMTRSACHRLIQVSIRCSHMINNYSEESHQEAIKSINSFNGLLNDGIGILQQKSHQNVPIIKSHLPLLLTLDSIYNYDIKPVRPGRMFPGFAESFVKLGATQLDEK